MGAFRTTQGLDDAILEDGDIGFLGVNQRVPRWQLGPGMLSLSENGRIDGEWFPRKGVDAFTSGMVATGSPLRVPFVCEDTGGGLSVSAASRTGGVCSLTVTSHGWVVGAVMWVTLSGVTFATVDPNGCKWMTVHDVNTLRFAIATGNETYGTAGKVRSVLNDTATGDLLGACVFSDPAAANAEHVFLAYGTNVAKVAMGSGTITILALPGSNTLDGNISMIQALDRVIIFRPGLIALEWKTGDAAFSEVAHGAYTQPQVLAALDNAISVADGLVTFGLSGNTTIAAGDAVVIYSATDTRFADVVGNSYQVYSASATEVKCYIALPDSAVSGSGTKNVQIGCQVSVGGGFIHQPGFPWAIYFQRRLWGPYRYYWNSTAFAARNVQDELIVSDILDKDTYDTIANQFRITGGTSDHIVALHPFYEDTLLVFNRNSIHSVAGTVGSLQDTVVRELTREIGCLARRSVVTQGTNIFFLSDNGVYGLQFGDQYTLRGVEKPLSEKIQSYIDRISANLAGEAVGIYFDNRYWLAVPMDSSVGAGDAAGNNAILVFNLLNNEWESVDTFGDPGFLIKDFLTATAGVRNDLFAVTPSGGLHVLNALDEDFDRIASNPVSGSAAFPVNSVVVTRGYMCGIGGRKRFSRVGVQLCGGSTQSDAAISILADDPDAVDDAVLASSLLGGNLEAQDTVDLRVRAAGLRAHNASVSVVRRIGRPKVRGVRVFATETNRSGISQH